MKVSVIIPSYKDPLLQKTIDNLLRHSALGKELEIVVVLDGYWPKESIKDDSHVKIIHLGKNRGMRGAINAGVEVSTGEYIMRVDEHQIFGKDYDKILLDTYNVSIDSFRWIVTPRRYFLNTILWEIMDIPPVDYAKLVIQDCGMYMLNGTDTHIYKFSGAEWKSRRDERKDVMIDETMAMQGSCWFMKRKWWDEVIGELQSEGYGTHYGDSHEMVFKTWKADGKLMVNKNTWHAHKHRMFPRTHNYGTREAASGWMYSINLWKSYYEVFVRPRWRV